MRSIRSSLRARPSAVYVSIAALAATGAFVAVACAPSQAGGGGDHTFDADAGDGGLDSGAGGGATDAPIFDVPIDIPNHPNCNDPTDTDGDGIADQLELAPDTDTDGDGTPDFQDDDSDGDGWLDQDEAANPSLGAGVPGQTRSDACSPLADTDGDGIPDVRDLDSDGDGVPDDDEAKYDPQGAKGCRVKADCDDDGVVDVVELAAGSDPTDGASQPSDATLYFVLPYNAPEKTRDFDFSTGIKDADIYFLIDTTKSMQPTIDNVRTSLDATIIPTILNGDPNASPPIPAIPGAHVGIGDFRDVPWAPYGNTLDDEYRSKYDVGGTDVYGNVSAPKGQAPNFTAPDNVKQILGQLTADGGGDSPEATTQALWMAVTGQPYQVYLGGGPWSSTAPSCGDPSLFGAACFRPNALPVFVLISDAPFHNGPSLANDYDTTNVAGTVTYQQTIDALNQVGAKTVGVAVNTGTPGLARADMKDLATQTQSLYHDDAFGGSDIPLVTAQDTTTGSVSSEAVRLIGLLAGQGLHNVTTAKSNYDCAGGVDCTGDGVADPAYHNPQPPADASEFLKSIEALDSAATPLPYASKDATTFYGVKGDAQVTFRVHAQNTIVSPKSLEVFRAKIQVETPKGQVLGGAAGVKIVYIVVPRYIPTQH